MSFELPADARAWQARARAFVDEDLIPWEVEAELNNGEIPAEVRDRHRATAQDMGLPAMDVSRERGGLGLGNVTQVAIYEELGRVTNALGWCFSEAHRWMFEACDEGQIERFVLPIMRGERHECYAITESESGSDVEGIAATARRTGKGTGNGGAGDYLLSGEKWYVTSANFADFCVFQAKIATLSQDGPHEGAHALFFVDLDSPGIEMVASPLFGHTYAHHHPTYRFTDVRVPAANLIGAEGDGMAFSYAWFRRERLMIAARCCGAAARLIEEATAFAKERRVSGEPIANYQAIQFMLADSVTELWAARLMTYECAAAHDRGEDVKLLHARCAMAKLYASEMANRVADRAVQIFGGRGYMRENVAERFFRELRVDRIWEGTSEIQRLIIAGGHLKRGLPELGAES